jgi:divalent metal cation (Fe/Co/Zn/Cd) transporter
MTPAVELPTVGAAPTAAEDSRRTPAAITRDRYEQLAGRVKLLSWLSLAWMTVEGAVALAAGIVAGSIALVGFGLDSAIEGFASVIIIWRFSGHRVFSHAAEQRAQKLVAVQFFLLAPYVAVESGKSLIGGEHADVSWVGIGLAIGSVICMPILGIAKQRLADELGSAATAGEGRQNMLCAYLAAALLIGLLGNALAGAWWLDPAVGVLIAGVAVREGVEAWRGEGCCVSSPLDGVGFADDACQGDCCAAPQNSPD